MYWNGTHWEPEGPVPEVVARPSRFRHAVEAATEGALVGLLVVGLLAGTVFAGRNSGVISVPDGTYGGTVTATMNPGGAETWARAFCYQGGEKVYGQYVRVNADNQATFTLGPTQRWQGGDATCVAEEIVKRTNGAWRVLASTEFHVEG